MSLNRSRLREQLIHHEGVRRFPYADSVGKLTIGVGRNLEDNGLSEKEIGTMLDNDIDAALDALHNLPLWHGLNGPRQEVIVNMTFNMGIYGVLKFKRMLSAIENGDFVEAAEEMLDSKWARQVGSRAKELASIMKEGRYA